jgi:hypothetical protein
LELLNESKVWYLIGYHRLIYRLLFGLLFHPF